MIFLLSVGADPTESIEVLARRKKVRIEFALFSCFRIAPFFVLKAALFFVHLVSFKVSPRTNVGTMYLSDQ